MTTPGQRLYERYRRQEVSAENWMWLPQSERDFWETLAKEVNKPW